MNDSGFRETDRASESRAAEAGTDARQEDERRRQEDERRRQEDERRRQERRARVLARHPRIGWLLLALAGAQAHGEGWRGGVEEEKSARPDRREPS